MSELIDALEPVCRSALSAVSPDDESILIMGSSWTGLAEALKAQRSARLVFGAACAADIELLEDEQLDAAFAVDPRSDEDLFEGRYFDCIVVDDLLLQADNPGDLLIGLRRRLNPGGRLVCALPNIQHYSALASIIAGDFQYQDDGPFNRRYLRFVGTANIQKLFLDAGFLPRLVEQPLKLMPDEAIRAFVPIIDHLRLNREFFVAKASATHQICVGYPLPEVSATNMGITFIAAVNNERQLKDNLLASPIFEDSRHEFIGVTGAASAAEALNTGMARSLADNAIVVLVHQDIYLPKGWDDRLIHGLFAAEAKFGPVGIAGVFGVVRAADFSFQRAGKVLDRRTLLATPHDMPARATSLDEIVLALPVRGGSIVGLDENLGFHMYGSEACLASNDAGRVPVIVDAPCLHNSESGYGLDNKFAESAQRFAQKRRASFPYATTCIQFTFDGQATVW